MTEHAAVRDGAAHGGIARPDVRVSVLQPRTVRDAQRRCRSTAGALYAAGATALQLAWGEQPRATLIPVGGLAALRGIALVDGRLRIGAAETLEAVRTHPLVRAHAPLLEQACASLAAFGVRNMATLGGNVAWRFGDTLAPLLACEALAEGSGRVLSSLDRWLDSPPDTLLVALHLPLARRCGGWLEKVGLRAAFSPSRVALCMRHGRDGVRLAAVGAGLRARRCRAVESWWEAWGMHGSSPPPRFTDSMGHFLREACAADLHGDGLRAEIASRVIAGHLQAGTCGHPIA